MNTINEGSSYQVPGKNPDYSSKMAIAHSYDPGQNPSKTHKPGENAENTPSPNRYKKSTIFDAERTEISPDNYRGGFKDNKNKIINNNTQFRIFNQIKPRDGNVAPLENLNLNPNKWKPRVTYYFRENKGEITDNKTPKYGSDNLFSERKNRDRRYLFSKRRLQEYLSNTNTKYSGDGHTIDKSHSALDNKGGFLHGKSSLTPLNQTSYDRKAMRQVGKHHGKFEIMPKNRKIQH